MNNESKQVALELNVNVNIDKRLCVNCELAEVQHIKEIALKICEQGITVALCGVLDPLMKPKMLYHCLCEGVRPAPGRVRSRGMPQHKPDR